MNQKYIQLRKVEVLVGSILIMLMYHRRVTIQRRGKLNLDTNKLLMQEYLLGLLRRSVLKIISCQ